jgi:FkbM family methyltransferase
MIGRMFLLVCLLALSCFLLLMLEVPVPSSLVVSRVNGPTKQRLANGCYQVFLDVGANVGVHGRFLLEPEKYPDAVTSKSLFDNEFGTKRDNRDFCVFAFEPNPGHKARLEEVASAYQRMGWRYEVFPVAVGAEDGNMTFFHMGDESHNEWGFSSVRKHNVADKQELIPVIRLASWLLDHVHDRVVPTPFGTYTSGPKVVMKMDIEGTEFSILPDVIASGALCSTVDFVFTETHFHFAPMYFEKQGLYLNDSAAAHQFYDAALKLMEVSPSCKTIIAQADDESHLLDGMPLP